MTPDYNAQMREWAERNGVKPLQREAHRLRKGLRWRDEAQREFYAGWDAYETAMRSKPYVTRDLQSRAEVVELELWWKL